MPDHQTHISFTEIEPIKMGLKGLGRKIHDKLAREVFFEETDPKVASDKLYRLMSGTIASQHKRKLFIEKSAPILEKIQELETVLS